MRSLGAHKANKKAPAAPDANQDEQQLQVTTPQTPKGIKRTLGGRTVNDTVESTTATAASLPQSKPRSAEKSKGINRTLGSRTAEVADQDTQEPSAQAVSAQNKQTTQPTEQGKDKEQEKPVDDEAADQKRLALKQQFAAAATYKPKRRKF
jgi:hypothetical protein